MVNNHNPYFLNGRSFLFQKWSLDFHPTKENVKEILVWIKLSKFPLCGWNQVGISIVASRIEVPMVVDSLTAAKTHT